MTERGSELLAARAPLAGLLLLAVAACGHEPPRAAPISSPASRPSAAAGPASITPLARPPPPSRGPEAVRARRTRPRPEVEARVVRLGPGDVILDGGGGELRLHGVDGAALGWRAGDVIVVAGAAPAAGVIDCAEAARCSVGLRSGGDVALYGVDAHAALPLLESFGVSALVVGPSRPAWLELRATQRETLALGWAAAFGLAHRRYKHLDVFAPPATLAAFAERHVPLLSRRMDLELRGVELRRLADLFAGVSRRPLRGELEGSVSIHGRDVESSEALDLVFGLCGVSFAPRGPDLVLTQTGSACAAHPPLAPPCSPPSLRGAAALGCLAVDDLELMGLALPPGPLATPRALLGSGPPEGAVVAVRAGESLPQTMELERPEGRVELTWRVGAIEREGVELLLADRSLGDSDSPHERRRLTAP